MLHMKIISDIGKTRHVVKTEAKTTVTSHQPITMNGVAWAVIDTPPEFNQSKQTSMRTAVSLRFRLRAARGAQAKKPLLLDVFGQSVGL